MKSFRISRILSLSAGEKKNMKNTKVVCRQKKAASRRFKKRREVLPEDYDDRR
jgi:hypothetical protein